MDFATKVRVLRAIRNWSHVELSKKIGVQWRTVSLWETGKSSPQFSSVEKIDKLLKEALKKSGLEYKE